MRKTILLALAGAATLVLAACGETEAPKGQSQAPATSPPQTQAPAPEARQSTLMEKAMDVAKEARQATVDEATRAVEAARASADEAIERGREAADRAAQRGKTLGQEALQQGRIIAELTGDKAEALIQQAKDAIDQKRPEIAREIVARLQQVKESLPQGLRNELDRLDARLAGSKSTSPEEPAAPPSY